MSTICVHAKKMLTIAKLLTFPTCFEGFSRLWTEGYCGRGHRLLTPNCKIFIIGNYMHILLIFMGLVWAYIRSIASYAKDI